MAFRYEKRSYSDAKERVNSRGGGFDSYIKPKYKMYKVKDGRNNIRILPPTWKGNKHYGLSVYLNYGIGPDNQSYLSLSKMLGKPDPIAEARAAADRDGDEEQTRALQARERVLIWIIDRDAEEEGPLIWACPQSADRDILSISMDDETQELMAIDHPDEGMDLRFYREGKGLNTKYPAAKMRLGKPSPISDDSKQQEAWEDYIKANPLPDCLQYYDYDHIAQVFNGHAKSDDEKPAAKARRDEPEDDEKPTKARKAEPEDDPEDEPEEKPRRLAKAESEDEAPKARSRPRLKEPEDDAGDDEDERPRAKRAKSEDDDDRSIRDRLKERRKAKEADDDDD